MRGCIARKGRGVREDALERHENKAADYAESDSAGGNGENGEGIL